MPIITTINTTQTMWTFGWRNNDLNNFSICHFQWWWMHILEVGSPLKSVFATRRCNQAADMGPHSRWQAFNSNTTHQPACNDLASRKHVGSVRTWPTVTKFERLFESVQRFLISISSLQMRPPAQLPAFASSQWKDDGSAFFYKPSVVYQMQRRQPTRDTGQQGQHKYQYNTASLLRNNRQVTQRRVEQILNVQQHDSAEQTGWTLTGVALCRKASLLLVKTLDLWK